MNKQITRKILIVASFLLIGVLGVSFRLYYLQVVSYEKLAKKARFQHHIELTLEPQRGDIVDRNGEPFAISVDSKSVWADPRKISNPYEVASQLFTILDVDVQKIAERLSKKKSFVWVKRKITEGQVVKLKTLDLPGIYLLEEPKRFYPKGNMLSHVMGFVGIDNKGLEGLELRLDKYLKGIPGKRVTGRDRKGREVITMRDEEVPPVQGYNVVLTIDEVIQHIAEKELEKVYQKYNPTGAMIVVMNPKTGEVLALSNRPTYNSNKVRVSNSEMRRNRTVTDYFEPGSTFKVISGAAALDQGVVRLNEKIFCENGAFWHAGHVLHDTHPYGDITFKEVIEKSSNIGTAKIAFRLGSSRLYNYIRRFGFGSSTRSGLFGETGGVVYPPKKWSKYSLVAVPMGQEVGVTALQITSAISSIANGGKLMKPLILHRIVDENNKLIKEWQPQEVRQVVSKRVANDMTRALEGVVSRKGTAYRARVPGYRIAGKTGTAQKAEPGKGYSKTKYVASFIGFAPAQDPRICIGVFVDEPKGAYYGGVVAAPVFANVAAEVLKHLDVAPENVIQVENQLQSKAPVGEAVES